MTTYTICFFFVAVLFSAGISQGTSIDLGDQIYDQFASMIELEQQFADAKLNFIISVLENVLSSAPTDTNINASLTECFADALNQYPSADPDCVEGVNTTVQGIIYDSQQQLGYCANLTHGWLVAKGLLPAAESANASLAIVVSQIMVGAQKCEKRYSNNPNREYNCMMNVQQQYNDAWQNATVPINQAYCLLSGVSLLVGLNINDCLNMENATLQAKCTDITAEVYTCTQSVRDKAH